MALWKARELDFRSCLRRTYLKAASKPSKVPYGCFDEGTFRRLRRRLRRYLKRASTNSSPKSAPRLPQFAPTEGLCPFLQFFTLYCSFAANRRMWTLSTSVVSSGWFAGVFLFSVTVLWSVFVMFDWWTLLDDVDQEIDSFWTFRCPTAISVVHMDAYVLKLRLQLLEVFRLHVATTCFQETFLGNETYAIVEGKSGTINKELDFRSWHCGRQGRGKFIKSQILDQF